MNYKDEFIQIFNANIKRDGAKDLLAWIEHSDFFSAPCSTRFHLHVPGGLAEHSVNVYKRLLWFVDSERANGSDFYDRCFAGMSEEQINETIAVVALLHDLCKANTYKACKKNVKNKDTGRWEEVDAYEFDERFVFGHGEKSVFIIQNYMKLTPAEATAIRFHMGAWEHDDQKMLDGAWDKYPLGFALHIADYVASQIDEHGK